jgi:hypothetical protein
MFFLPLAGYFVQGGAHVSFAFHFLGCSSGRNVTSSLPSFFCFIRLGILLGARLALGFLICD